MAENRGVAYMGTGKVEVQDIDFPTFELKDGPGVNPDNVGRKLPHAAILKVVSTNICGSDQHMVRGRTTAPEGLILGHEITGEVIDIGPDVEFIEKGDLCSVPFNIACGRCRNCNEGKTGVCLNVNPACAGSAYGYVDMGGWVGGQAEYVLVPFADFNLLKFPDRDQALEKILDLTMLSDIFPTGYHGAYTAQVTTGSTVYVAGAGPVGLAAAYSPPSFLGHFTVFALAIFVGYYVISNVAHALHTPLMSETNAISGIIVVGGILQVGSDNTVVTVLALIAVLVASINIFGGFLVTLRMLEMFRKD